MDKDAPTFLVYILKKLKNVYCFEEEFIVTNDLISRTMAVLEKFVDMKASTVRTSKKTQQIKDVDLLTLEEVNLNNV